jgi:hypothetical protein
MMAAILRVSLTCHNGDFSFLPLSHFIIIFRVDQMICPIPSNFVAFLFYVSFQQGACNRCTPLEELHVQNMACTLVANSDLGIALFEVAWFCCSLKYKPPYV